MKILLDNNLSHRLIARLNSLFEECQHVKNVGLDLSDDTVVWQFAKENDYTIVTKDDDFSFISRLRGYPPKIIWLKIGNCSTATIEQVIRDNIGDIHELFGSETGMIEVEKSN